MTSKRIQFGLEGDTVRIECVAFAIPRPEKVTWTHHGYEVDSGNILLYNRSHYNKGFNNMLLLTMQEIHEYRYWRIVFQMESGVHWSFVKRTIKISGLIIAPLRMLTVWMPPKLYSENKVSFLYIWSNSLLLFLQQNCPGLAPCFIVFHRQWIF